MLPNRFFGQREATMLAAHRDGRLTDLDFFEGELMELLKKQIVDQSAEGLIAAMEYAYGYRKTETFVEGFGELDMNPMVRFYPNLSVAYRQVLRRMIVDITSLGGTKLLWTLVNLLEKQATERPYETIYFPSVDWTDQSGFGSADWEYELVQFLRDSAIILAKEEQDWLVDTLMSSACHTCWRLGLNIINKWFGELGHHFWTWTRKNPLDGVFPHQELALLFGDKLTDIKSDQFSSLVTWIECLSIDNEHLPKEEVEAIKKEQVFRYLSALHISDNELKSQLAAVSNKYKPKYYVETHPDGYSSPDFGTEGFDDPVIPSGFDKMIVVEQVAYLSKYPGKGRFDFASTSLGLTMNNLIIEQPQKYMDSLDELGKAPRVYLEQFISIFAQVLKNGSISDFWPLIKTFSSWLETGNDNIEKTYLDNYALGTFLYGLADQIRQFDYSQDDIHELIAICIATMKNEGNTSVDRLERDIVTHTLNSGYHKLFQAATIFDELVVVDGDKHSANKISPALLAYIEEGIATGNKRNVEFRIALGMYFPYLLVAEEKWVAEHLLTLFPSEDEIFKRYMIMGILTSNYRPTLKLIKFLRDRSVMGSCLKHFTEEGPALARLGKLAVVELSSVDRESINNPVSIVGQILENGNKGQYSNLIKTASFSELVPDEILLKLWNALLERAFADQANLGNIIVEVLDLIRPLSIISKETVSLIEKSLPILKPSRHGNNLVRNLLGLPSESITGTARLIIKIWKQTGIQPFVTKELEQLVENLYLSAEDAIADEICIHVSDTGAMGLKKIYDLYKRGKF